MFQMTKNERVQLNNLSKLVYGSSSKWQKMIEKDELSNLKRTLEDGTEESYRGYKTYSLEEVKTKMETLFQEKLAKEKLDEEKAKEAQNVVKNEEVGQKVEEISGSQEI